MYRDELEAASGICAEVGRCQGDPIDVALL